MRRVLYVLVIVLSFSSAAHAQGFGRMYDVTITNLTPGQTFTPLLVATHRPTISLFEVGEAASAELATLAESGNIGPLNEVLLANPDLVRETASSLDVLGMPGLLGPGESVTIRISGNIAFNRLSIAGMLIPTNDTFVALDSARLPFFEESYLVAAYDAGSEYNDEMCASIPGPMCGGEGDSEPAFEEGFVHISRGIHGIGDLVPALYDWRNPVARVDIRRAF